MTSANVDLRATPLGVATISYPVHARRPHAHDVEREPRLAPRGVLLALGEVEGKQGRRELGEIVGGVTSTVAGLQGARDHRHRWRRDGPSLPPYSPIARALLGPGYPGRCDVTCDVTGVTTTPMTSPFTAFFWFLDDVGMGRQGGPAPRYRMRSG